jgi:hypothetical protein
LDTRRDPHRGPHRCRHLHRLGHSGLPRAGRGWTRDPAAAAAFTLDPTPYDELAAEVIRTDIVEAVPAIVDRLVGARA